MNAAFVSYSRKDSEFVQRLVRDLKAGGANVWLDRFDIKPGTEWDRAVEEALEACPTMLLVLSPTSAASKNVLDEITVAMRMGKTIVPIMREDCAVPMRVCRLQYLDFRTDYDAPLGELLLEFKAQQGPGKAPRGEAARAGPPAVAGREAVTPVSPAAAAPIAITPAAPVREKQKANGEAQRRRAEVPEKSRLAAQEAAAERILERSKRKRVQEAERRKLKREKAVEGSPVGDALREEEQREPEAAAPVLSSAKAHLAAATTTESKGQPAAGWATVEEKAVSNGTLVILLIIALPVTNILGLIVGNYWAAFTDIVGSGFIGSFMLPAGLGGLAGAAYAKIAQMTDRRFVYGAWGCLPGFIIGLEFLKASSAKHPGWWSALLAAAAFLITTFSRSAPKRAVAES